MELYQAESIISTAVEKLTGIPELNKEDFK